MALIRGPYENISVILFAFGAATTKAPAVEEKQTANISYQIKHKSTHGVMDESMANHPCASPFNLMH